MSGLQRLRHRQILAAAFRIVLFAISIAYPSFASSHVEKAEKLHRQLQNIDSKLNLKLKLSSILDLEWLKSLNTQELNYIRKAHDSRYKDALEQPHSERVLMSGWLVMDIISRYYFDLEPYLPESDEEKSKLYHRIVNIITFTEENLADMVSGDGMWLMGPGEFAHLKDQIDEAKRHKRNFIKRYGHLDQESFYNIAMPYVYKGVAAVIVSGVAYFFGKWCVARKTVQEKSDETKHDNEESCKRRRGRGHNPWKPAVQQAPQEVPLTPTQIEKQKQNKFSRDAIHAINKILTNENKHEDEYYADFSGIGDEITKLVKTVPKQNIETEYLKKLNAVKDRLGTVAHEEQNLQHEKLLKFYKKSLESYLKET